MATDIFASLKQRANNPLLAKEQFDNAFSKNNYVDNTFWKPTKDGAGNAAATIRFLPIYDIEELKKGNIVQKKNIVEYFSHFFQTPCGKYYVENSLTTFNETDYIGEYCRLLWQAGETDPAMKKLQEKYRRRRHFVANILVIDDSGNKENNGKVFKYKFGVKVFEKIKEKIQPEFEGDAPVDVFDLFAGANFKLRIKKKDGYDNYDSSTFDSPTPIVETAEDVLKLEEQVHDIEYLINREKSYKTHEELKKSFITAFGSDVLAEFKGEETQFKPATQQEQPINHYVSTPRSGPSESEALDDEESLKKLFAS